MVAVRHLEFLKVRNFNYHSALDSQYALILRLAILVQYRLVTRTNGQTDRRTDEAYTALA